MPILTPRQSKILQLIQAGKTNAEIARQFALAPDTIRTFIAHIRHKTGAKNRTELMAVQVDD